MQIDRYISFYIILYTYVVNIIGICNKVNTFNTYFGIGAGLNQLPVEDPEVSLSFCDLFAYS